MRWWILTALCIAALAMAGAPAYPIRISANSRYLIDANGNPFFLQGDAGWLVAKQCDTADQDYYVTNRAAQGYNAIMLDMHAWYAGGGIETGGVTTDYYGNLPFTSQIVGPFTNLSPGVNPSFMTNVDHVVNKAASLGMLVFMYPMYDGQPGNNNGWIDQENGNGSNALYSYGVWLGTHYAAYTNLFFVIGGDSLEPNAAEVGTAISLGILSEMPGSLFTAQASASATNGNYNLSARTWYTNSWCNVNSSYARSPNAPYITYDAAITNYWNLTSPIYPTFSREPYYEETPYVTANTAFDLRRYEWGSVTYGECGFFYGDAWLATYDFTNGWQPHMFTSGATNIPCIGKLFNTRDWWNFIPDTNHAVITSGYGTYVAQNFITCTRSSKTIVAYIPSGTLTPTVAMNQIAGSTADCWWYNVTNGAAVFIANYATTGSKTFTPPDSDDWVLVLDSHMWYAGTAPATPPPFNVMVSTP
jgi:uncharacterized protein DUF4038/collagenase-like protein with putative collagen-binding domain